MQLPDLRRDDIELTEQQKDSECVTKLKTRG
jgi:hypothetical protein